MTITAKDKINKCIYNHICYKRTKQQQNRLYYKRCYPIKNRYNFMRSVFRKINPNQDKHLKKIYFNIKYDNLVSEYNKFIDYLEDDELKLVGWSIY
jgi:effector-binding domain-containing protein